MLDLILIVLPGTLAFLISRYLYQERSIKKSIFYILLYTVSANLCIWGGLKLIGMQKFNLFEMGISFKAKWIILEFAFSAWLTWLINNIRKTEKQLLTQLLQRLFPSTLLLIITYAIFTPSSLFLGNINEFSIPYSKILPVLLCMAFSLFLGIYLLALWLIRGKAIPFYIAFIFSLSIAIYIQTNFLNSKLPILDGALIIWTDYQTENVISTLSWLLCFLLFFIIAYFQKERFEKYSGYISYFLSAVQLVSLVVLVFTNQLDSQSSYDFSKEGEFTIGSEENIIIFVVDTLQADVMDEYLRSDAYQRDGNLDGFTFFDNTVSGGAPTHIAMPLLLTGIEYDPMQTRSDYKTEVWEDTPFYADLLQNGYDIRFYTSAREVFGFAEGGFPVGTVDNYAAVGNNWISDYPGFGKALYQLVNYLSMPQFIKQHFWLSTDTLLYSTDSNGYTLDDIRFHSDFVAAGENVQTDCEKAFRLYHLNGLHPPYNMTEDFDRVWANGVAKQNVLQGVMKIIYSYTNALKQAGVYDTSTIIIAGDHGQHSDGNPETNPALLIKLPGDAARPITYNSAPVHFRNVVPTIAGTFLSDYSAYGPGLFDISEASDVERLHTIDFSVERRINLQDPDKPNSFSRLIISGRADAFDWELWDPYQINYVDYPIGTVIDFTSDNKYADQIDYRLYKENGTATASNELSICFHLENYENDNLELHFIPSGITNGSQTIRIYANGDKVENIACTQNDIKKEMVAVIPKDKIQDDLLVLRMVFPNAVTPNQLDRSNTDMRILSVSFSSLWLE